MQALSDGQIKLARFDKGHEGIVVESQRGFQCILTQLGKLVDPVVVPAGRKIETALDLVERYGLPGAVLVFRSPDIGDVLDEVAHADKLIVAADRHVVQQHVGTKPLANTLHAVAEIGAHAIHLVDVAHARNVVLVGQTPVGFSLWLYPGYTVKNNDGPVEYAQTPVDLDGEIHVSRRVDDVDLMAFPLGRHGSALNRDAALPLLLHVIGRGAALAVLGVMHLDDLVLLARVVQHALGSGGFTCIDVRHDTDVAVELDVFLPGHNPDFVLCTVEGRQRHGATRVTITSHCSLSAALAANPG